MASQYFQAVFFIYGLSFFSMGLVVAKASRRARARALALFKQRSGFRSMGLPHLSRDSAWAGVAYFIVSILDIFEIGHQRRLGLQPGATGGEGAGAHSGG